MPRVVKDTILNGMVTMVDEMAKVFKISAGRFTCGMIKE